MLSIPSFNGVLGVVIIPLEVPADEVAKIREILHERVDGNSRFGPPPLKPRACRMGRQRRMSELRNSMTGMVQAKQEEDDNEKWIFSLTPLHDFNATLDDLWKLLSSGLSRMNRATIIIPKPFVIWRACDVDG